MKGLIHFLIIGFVCSFIPVFADFLPSLQDEEEWKDYFVGFEQRSFDYGLTASGEGRFFPKSRRGKRVPSSRTVLVNVICEKKQSNGWRNQTRGTSDYETDLEPTLKPTAFELVNHFTGETKVTSKHRFERKAVEMSVSLTEGKQGSEKRAGIRVEIPDLYRLAFESTERDMKSEVRGDELVMINLKGKTVELGLEEDVDLAELDSINEGVRFFSIKSKKLEEKTLTMSIVGEGKGKMIVRRASATLFDGLVVTFYPDEAGPVEQWVRFEVK